MKSTRSPICTVMGHVDHGKSSILDNIRGSAIVKSEAGAITQAIGASIIPLNTIKNICGDLLKQLKMDFTIPGLLFIDTPGHAAFTNLRKRGGNLADIAILVIDVNEGIKPQTMESIEILKQYKTPFVIALNKIDLISGWQTKKINILSSITQQSQSIQQILDKKLYELVGKLSEIKINSERFDRVDDYTKQIAMIPCSAKTGEGIPELLMVLTGLAQRFLEKCLECDVDGSAKGTILEVKEEKGLGKTIDVIIYDGTLKTGDTIVIAGLEKSITTKVKALFEPVPLAEIRDKKSNFKSVKKVSAATGVKISALDIDEVVSGMPLRSCQKKEIEKTKQELQQEVKEVLIETDKEGIVIKADSLGSLEALIKLLKENEVSIRRASIGNITKKDIAEAESNFEKDPLKSVILAFNIEEGSVNENVKIISSDIIYKIIEDYDKWKKDKLLEMQECQIDKLIRPCKIKIMAGYIFRQSNPAIVGSDILAGTLRIGMPLMNSQGKEITEVKSIQADKDKLEKAESGKQVAVSMPNVTVGRQINENDELYSSIPEEDFKKLKNLKEFLTKEEVEVIKEIAEIKRKENVVWGV
ncbi:translation initiation factor IF-2 [Candidatus Woesearchaeota archaeon B3_Woes]|nr:MAG: translation initiation factor IF-2 [Candidatus Woesearchaeota archaeon B3_Woes]